MTKAGEKLLAGAREAVSLSKVNCFPFVAESNQIEGIFRVTPDEVDATERLLDLKKLTLDDVCDVQAMYAPNMPIRDRVGMNVS